ncbi:hypothetical protein JCM10213_002917 [Rhodosporidiobolus nylandii]
MKPPTLLALSATLALYGPWLSLAQPDHAGGGHHLPASDAQQTHRRHHSKVASRILEDISSRASRVSEAVSRAVRMGPTDEAEVDESSHSYHSAGGLARETPHSFTRFQPGDESVGAPSQPPVVGNTTSSGFASSSTGHHLPADPAYHGPVLPANHTVEKRGVRKTGWSLKGLHTNGVAIGFLPDDGSGGGQTETIEMIEAKLGCKVSAQGWYAQASADKPFDGSQFEARKTQIRDSDAVFQATVMPTSWKGFTWEDNSQAIRVANYLQQWVNVGKEVWLRFGHEVNYYQTDGTYQGNVNDFKLGWAVMAKARKDLAPEVKMWFTPNFANLQVYDKFYPDDPNTVDLIGVDWYPHQLDNFDFAYGPCDMKKFHDKYTNSRVKFAIGEIGLGIAAPMASRLAWLENILEAKKVMPNMIAVSCTGKTDYGDEPVVKYLRST